MVKLIRLYATIRNLLQFAILIVCLHENLSLLTYSFIGRHSCMLVVTCGCSQLYFSCDWDLLELWLNDMFGENIMEICI